MATEVPLRRLIKLALVKEKALFTERFFYVYRRDKLGGLF